jgi:hypothetical protein
MEWERCSNFESPARTRPGPERSAEEFDPFLHSPQAVTAGPVRRCRSSAIVGDGHEDLVVLVPNRDLGSHVGAAVLQYVREGFLDDSVHGGIDRHVRRSPIGFDLECNG